MNTTPFKKTGLETLLTPENSALSRAATPLKERPRSAGPRQLGSSWAREATAKGLAPIAIEHYGATGTSFLWEQQLLNQGGSNRR
jgi:hypothetical protein